MITKALLVVAIVGHFHHHHVPVPREIHIDAGTYHESDEEAAERDSSWEARCGTMLYTDPANYAHAAAVAHRCGTRLR